MRHYICSEDLLKYLSNIYEDKVDIDVLRKLILSMKCVAIDDRDI